MRKPEESLDDFTVKAIELEKVPGPPAVVWLRFTGGVEVVKPLASRQDPTHPGPTTGNRISWFHRSLAVSGALAVIALIFLSAIFIGIYDRPTGPEVAAVDTDGAPDDAAIVSQLEQEQLAPDIPTSQNATPVDDAARPVYSSKPRLTGRVHRAAYEPRRQSRRPQHGMTRFVPTTLVISAENGEIKTRIEPQLAAVYKKPLTITN
jgi:hypothetical protein